MSGDPVLEVQSGDAAIRIRHATRGDLNSVEVIDLLSREAPHWPAAKYADMLLEHPDRRQRRVLLVAEREDMIAGYVVVSDVLGEAELESVVVHPDLRRRGIGRRLCEAALAWARASGDEEIHLEVRASNSAALTLYQQLGFAKEGNRRRYYLNPVDDAVMMTAKLAPV